MEFIWGLVSAVATALVEVALGLLAFRLVGRYWPPARRAGSAMRRPFFTFALAVAANVAVRKGPMGTASWWGLVQQACHIAVIGATAWLVGAILVYLEDVSLRRHSIDVPDNREARRLRTQVLLLRRLTIGALVVIAIGATLLSFPGVRAVGASVLASAGVISIVAGLAAQSTLSNVFAGLTLAFSDALRIDDAIIVEEEWGWVEEITLTYVVVRLWDDRRLILPSTYFANNPFQNWTRHTSELLGSVELDVDWRVDTHAMRDQLDTILDCAGELWDGRVKVLQVTDAVAGVVRVRVLVTARDAPTLFDLRCHVREQLIAWLQRHDPDGLPRQRTELVESQARRNGTHVPEPRAGLFTGDAEAEDRAARAGGGGDHLDDEVQ